MSTFVNKKYDKLFTSWLIALILLIALMIVVGGLTRLTDSGLSITQWELFSGILPPFNNQDWIYYFNLYKEIPEYKLQNYSMTMSEFKIIFWWEWAHRFLGRVIGLATIIPLLYFSFKFEIKKLLNLYIIFFLICFQGFIGWYMVSSGLVDRVDVSHYRLSIHLLIAFIILASLFWNFLNIVNNKNKKFFLNKSNFISIKILIFLIFSQIVFGAFVSGLDAGKIYQTWPLMNDSYIPNDVNFSNYNEFLNFNDRSVVQFFHRNLAYIILIYYLILIYKIYKNNFTRYFNLIIIIGLILFIQVILGIFTLLSGAQIYLASMHQISSIFLVSSSVYFLFLTSKTN